MIIRRVAYRSGYTKRIEVTGIGKINVAQRGRVLLDLTYDDRQKIIDNLYLWMSNNHDQLGAVIEGITDHCGRSNSSNRSDLIRHKLNLKEKSNEEYYERLNSENEQVKESNADGLRISLHN